MPPKVKTETKLSKALKKIRNVINIFNFMVLGGFFSIIFGKDINTDHVLLGYILEETRKYWSSMLHVDRGANSKAFREVGKQPGRWSLLNIY
jgi:hypothetical protein